MEDDLSCLILQPHRELLLLVNTFIVKGCGADVRSLTDQSIKIGVRTQRPLGDQLLAAGGTLFIAGETTRKHVDLLPPEHSPVLT